MKLEIQNSINVYVLPVLFMFVAYLFGLRKNKKQFAMNKRYNEIKDLYDKNDELEDKISLCMPWEKYDEKEAQRKHDCEKQHSNCFEVFTLKLENNSKTNENLIQKTIEMNNSLQRNQIKLDVMTKNLEVTFNDIYQLPDKVIESIVDMRKQQREGKKEFENKIQEKIEDLFNSSI